METPEQNQICKKADTNKNAETTTESSNERESRPPPLSDYDFGGLLEMQLPDVIFFDDSPSHTDLSAIIMSAQWHNKFAPKAAATTCVAFGSPPQQSETIRSPCFRTMEARLASFKNFPSGNSNPHQQLAETGLYFTGYGDLCQCFSCGGFLKALSSGDDPIKEHARSFPNCSYINRLKGQQYVQSLQPRRLENEHICCRKDVIGGYYTSSQLSDRTGNITERQCYLSRCFHCEVGCRDWRSGDEPFKEDARYFSNCSFENGSNRQEYLQLLQQCGLKNKHICCRKDDIGGYYTSSQRLDRKGNITEREDICCFVNGGCIKCWRLCDKTIGEQDTYFSRDTYRNKSKRYTTRQRDVIKNASTSERNQHSASQTTQGNGYNFEYTSVLRKSTKHAVLHMDPRLVLDEFTTCGFLTNIEIRDIEELQLTSEKNRAILRKVMTKGVNGYKKFKSALKESNQTHLFDLLLREELS